ncbi:hypothetical protein NUW54_g2468 [Trametes sanguinea]|uniref:Uncharacterized protein n=2 Tax=Trametes sanguinea TaxID=158606 RepID=A0ACC1PYR5_9APHY|nr:hypothetical protein NUW54_g4156 [Trametes sanguinea]KAJ3010479.1 hypothetical protein NUW54_g2468 [Trametes sanguinea]
MQAKPARLIGQSPQSTAHHPSTRSPRASTSSSPLFIDIHSMTSRLPLELWEAVLDHCALPTQVDIRNRKLFHIRDQSQATHIQKYYATCVVLASPNDVDRLCDILTRRPHLTAFVRILSIAPTGHQPRPSRADFQFHVVPFARPQLTQHLNNLHSAVYIGSPWTEWPYPTAYNLTSPLHSTIRDFRWGRPARSRLPTAQEPGNPQAPMHFPRDSPNLCLRSLPFGLDADGQLFPQCENFNSPSFPLEDVFGTSATHVALSRQRGWAPESIGELRSIRYVSSLPSLQEVDLVFKCTFSPDVPAALSFVKDSVLSWMRPVVFAQEFFDVQHRLDVAFNNVPNLHDVSFILEFRRQLVDPRRKGEGLIARIPSNSRPVGAGLGPRPATLLV